MLRPNGSVVGLLFSGAVLLSAFSGTGCTAIFARSRIAGAESAISEAERAGAKAKAQYRYTLALLYLEKAREEEAFSRLGVATELGGKAEKYAVEAHQEANGELAPVGIIPMNAAEPSTAAPVTADGAAEAVTTTSTGDTSAAPPAPTVAPVSPPAQDFLPTEITGASAPAPTPAPKTAPTTKPAVTTPPAPPPPLPEVDPNAPLPEIPFPEDLPPTPPPPNPGN